MLLSLVVHLTALSDAALTGDTGRAAQALFLRWVQERDAALASALHDASEARPYTSSALLSVAQPLHCRAYDKSRPTAVQAGRAYWLRFTTLTAPLSRLLLDVAQDLTGHSLELGGAAFRVQNAVHEAQDHPWAGQSSYGDLAQAHFLNTGNPLRRVTLDFVSPTAFHHTVALTPNPCAASPKRSGGGSPKTTGRGEEALTQLPTANPGLSLRPRGPQPEGQDEGRQPPTAHRQPPTAQARQVTVPLPLPELVFGSLLMRWNAFAPIALPEEVRRYAQECLAVTRYRLQTHMLRFGQALIVGFTGQCQYTVLEWDAYWLRAIHLLAAYAFYSGVGVRTAVGMGQVHPQISQITQMKG